MAGVVQDQAVSDLACDPDQVQIEALSDSSFVASGCGQRATYVCRPTSTPSTPDSTVASTDTPSFASPAEREARDTATFHRSQAERLAVGRDATNAAGASSSPNTLSPRRSAFERGTPHAGHGTLEGDPVAHPDSDRGSDRDTPTQLAIDHERRAAEEADQRAEQSREAETHRATMAGAAALGTLLGEAIRSGSVDCVREGPVAAPRAQILRAAMPRTSAAAGARPAALVDTPGRAVVLRTMQFLDASIQRCRSGPAVTIQTTLVFERSGAVASVTVPAGLSGTPVGACVVRTARVVRLPAFRRPTFSVTYPLTLR